MDGLTIFINSKDTNDNFYNIFIDDLSKTNTRIIYAKNGFLENSSQKKQFKLFNGQVINKNKNEINAFKFDQIDFNLDEYSSSTILVPKIQELSSQYLFECFMKIKKNVKIDDKFYEFQCEKSLEKDILQELFKRFYKPLYIPIISLLTCFLIILSKNNVGYNKNKIIITLLTFLIIIVSEGSLRYSTTSITATYLYLILPILLFLFFQYILKKKLKYV